ncbi:cyclodeaminase/cyclohydrolase family protein [Sedimentibacter saalensis]|jgi:formiminotetrahydrofolate cyclodeaminase|uniref:Formiminotetrahydrofolate cyclodeaminase n=1 Tax=Sedimentibacter saalensis TaxID=130788 RepID=A0A562JBB3_9FIRM|nr:cyclodeaminase/cyclohydrolase family protein [Sedimentibacter saalensis]MEA5094073.1 cyclodeaminase/cyclohydrolase family protein [Sedimentibacter saalensis]TWH80491.1 formiminotetrahydrofolate cyclodeaminase [Sedimentibacter saalensis]
MKNKSIHEFAEVVASNSPVPGGGSIAALCGALSAALAEMVANLTTGKKKYIEVESEMNEIKNKAMALRSKLLDDIERDSYAYNKVMEAYKMPKEDDEQKILRNKAIEESAKIAAEVPLDVAQTSFKILPLAEAVVARGNSNAVTDGLVAAMLARTAVLSALLNVRINLETISDKDFVFEYKNRADVLQEETLFYEKKILELSPF